LAASPGESTVKKPTEKGRGKKGRLSELIKSDREKGEKTTRPEKSFHRAFNPGHAAVFRDEAIEEEVERKKHANQVGLGRLKRER